MAGYEIAALPAAGLADVRARGVDAHGTSVEHWSASGGEPLRCCLRDAAAGEDLILFGCEPRLPAASPYREVGAVFAHKMPCSGVAATDRYPTGWYGRSQVLRAYDRRGWIHAATRVHDGVNPEGVITAMLANPDIVEIHSRNVAYGCYMFAITRASTRAR